MPDADHFLNDGPPKVLIDALEACLPPKRSFALRLPPWARFGARKPPAPAAA